MRIYKKTIKCDICPICNGEYVLSLKSIPGVCIVCAFDYEHFNEMDW